MHLPKYLKISQISAISGSPRAFLAVILGLAPLAHAASKTSDWAVEGAPYRVVLHAGEAPGAPEAGWQIRLADFGAGRPDMRDVVLLGPDRKEIALDGVWRGTGRALLVLAESMPAGDAAATLYFGGTTARRMRAWTAKRSLLLETRRLPAGANVATFGGWQEAWKKSPDVDGMAFVPQIFHGDNPFGPSDHFLSRYCGLVKTGEGGARKFYTLSDDVSYVKIDGRAALKWQDTTPPPLDPKTVPCATVTVPKGLASVEYCHAVANPPAAMVLGWDQGGKLGNVPPEDWIHPGTVTAGACEALDGAPVPAGLLAAERYLGYGGEWYVRVKCAIPPPPAGWQVEWLWPDGRVDSGPEIHRLWMSLEPVRVTLRLRNGIRVIEGRQVLTIPQGMAADSVNDANQLAGFLELLDKEDPALLPEPALRSGFVLASDFLPSAAAARWADKWLEVAKPAAGPWVKAVAMGIQETAKRDPQAALDKLGKLPPPARAAMGRTADLLELDLRVFGLNDPLLVSVVARLRKSGDKALANMALIRLGDYHLLNGRLDEAARCFAEAVPDRAASERKAPVIDRSHSLAIEELVTGSHLDEARAKLDDWERQRPAARLEGDQLYWRARVLFLAGEWRRALLDLETSLKIRPGAPEELDVRFWQARALYELGRKDEARKIWNSLAKDYPKHERAEAAALWAKKP